MSADSRAIDNTQLSQLFAPHENDVNHCKCSRFLSDEGHLIFQINNRYCKDDVYMEMPPMIFYIMKYTRDVKTKICTCFAYEIVVNHCACTKALAKSGHAIRGIGESSPPTIIYYVNDTFTYDVMYKSCDCPPRRSIFKLC